MSDGISAQPLRRLPAVQMFAERADSRDDWRERVEAAGAAAVHRLRRLAGRATGATLMRRLRSGAVLDNIGIPETVARLAAVRAGLRRRGLRDDLVADALVLLREIARRKLGIAALDSQLLGAAAVLRGEVAEMASGEGKSLSAALAAAVAALAGIRVHVVTGSDLAAKRDAEAVCALFGALGLKAGVVEPGLAAAQRSAAYDCDVTYASARQIAADYLCDRIALGTRPQALRVKLRRLHDGGGEAGAVMRGLHFAIVDDSDNVLLDHARSPLMLSRTPRPEEAEHRRVFVAKMTCQRLFRRYRMLGGVSATAGQAARELSAVYRLPVVRIASEFPKTRKRLPMQVFRTADEKWRSIAQRAAAVVEDGRAVLIGARDAQGALECSRRLRAAGLECVTVSASNESDAIECVREAGKPGRITVVGDIGSGGIDIRPDEAVTELGGLHVISSEMQDCARLDRRLEGCCARRGDAGSCEAVLCLEDALCRANGDSLWLRLLRNDALRSTVGGFLMRRLQRRSERAQRRERQQIVRAEHSRARLLAISGGLE